MITKKYQKITLLNFMSFLFTVIKSGKLEESVSFLYWELSWLLFKKYIKKVYFRNEIPLIKILELDNVKDIDSHLLCEYPINFHLAFFDRENQIWCCRKDTPSILLLKKEDRLIKIYDFLTQIQGIFIDKRQNIFICSGGSIFRSEDKGAIFRKVLNLSSTKSFFLFETITEANDNTILIGEYANIKDNKNKWKFAGNLYISKDQGQTWIKTNFLQKYINKHIHIIKWIKKLKCLILTEGDNKKGIWTNYLNKSFINHGWFRLNRFHIQKGGYTSIVETKKNIILGTDYYHGTNFITLTEDLKKFRHFTIPDPYRKSAVFRMLYSEKKNIVWASLYSHISTNKSLLMYSNDFGTSWRKFLEYDGSKVGVNITSNSGEDFFFVQMEDFSSKSSKTFTVPFEVK